MHHSLRPLLLALVPLVVLACGGVVPASRLEAGHLAACPPKPHCVSTAVSEPPDRHMPPIPFADPPVSARRRLITAIGQEPRARIVTDSAGYVRAAVPTRVFRFVDDLEFLVDSGAHQIEFRSSARIGFNDWGVNRGRMERVAARLQPPR